MLVVSKASDLANEQREQGKDSSDIWGGKLKEYFIQLEPGQAQPRVALEIESFNDRLDRAWAALKLGRDEASGSAKENIEQAHLILGELSAQLISPSELAAHFGLPAMNFDYLTSPLNPFEYLLGRLSDIDMRLRESELDGSPEELTQQEVRFLKSEFLRARSTLRSAINPTALAEYIAAIDDLGSQIDQIVSGQANGAGLGEAVNEVDRKFEALQDTLPEAGTNDFADTYRMLLDTVQLHGRAQQTSAREGSPLAGVGTKAAAGGQIAASYFLAAFAGMRLTAAQQGDISEVVAEARVRTIDGSLAGIDFLDDWADLTALAAAHIVDSMEGIPEDTIVIALHGCSNGFLLPISQEKIGQFPVRVVVVSATALAKHLDLIAAAAGFDFTISRVFSGRPETDHALLLFSCGSKVSASAFLDETWSRLVVAFPEVVATKTPRSDMSLHSATKVVVPEDHPYGLVVAGDSWSVAHLERTVGLVGSVFDVFGDSVSRNMLAQIIQESAGSKSIVAVAIKWLRTEAFTKLVVEAAENPAARKVVQALLQLPRIARSELALLQPIETLFAELAESRFVPHVPDGRLEQVVVDEKLREIFRHILNPSLFPNFVGLELLVQAAFSSAKTFTERAFLLSRYISRAQPGGNASIFDKRSPQGRVGALKAEPGSAIEIVQRSGTDPIFGPTQGVPTSRHRQESLVIKRVGAAKRTDGLRSPSEIV